MATRNPSFYDWQNLTRNEVGGNFADAYQGYRAPNEWSLRDSSNGSPLSGPRNPMSDEQLLLLMNGRNSSRTRKIRTAADLQRAQEEAQFLDSIQAQDTAGIYSAPTDERSARLQSMLNQNYMARERGAQMIPTWQAIQSKRKTELGNLLDEQSLYQNPIKLKLAQQAASLNEDQFRDAVINHDNANILEQQKPADSDKWRQIQRDAQNQTHSDLQDQRDFQNTESWLRDKRANEQLTNQAFGQFHGAVEAGRMTANDAISSLPGLSQSQKTLLVSREKAANDTAARSEAEATRLNRALVIGLQQPRTGETATQFRVRFLNGVTKNKLAYWDEEQHSFVPTFQSAGNSADVQGPPRASTPVSIGVPPPGVDPEFYRDTFGGVTPDAPRFADSFSRVPVSAAAPVAGAQQVRVNGGNFQEGALYPRGSNEVWRYSNGTMTRIR